MTSKLKLRKRSPVITNEDNSSTDDMEEENTHRKNKTKKTSKKPREEKKGILRRFMNVAKVIVVIAILPPFLNYAALQRETSVLLAQNVTSEKFTGISLLGQLYDIGWGQKMYMACQGNGPPTVILDAPTGMSSDVWSLIWPEIAAQTRVCVYDRAGLGFSDRPRKNQTEADGADSKSNFRNRWLPFTAERMVDDMYHLTSVSSQQPQPLILVGAELGALVAQFYTQIYQRSVLGIVLINPLSEDIFEQDGGVWTDYWFGQLVPSYQTLQLGAALGLTRLALMVGLLHQPLSGAELPDVIANRQKHLMCQPKHLSTVVDEHHFMNESFSQMSLVRMLGSVPTNISVTVITGNYYDEQMPSILNKAWAKSEQNLLSKFYPHAKHIVVNNADKDMLYKNPSAIVEPVLKIVKNWKKTQKSSKKL